MRIRYLCVAFAMVFAVTGCEPDSVAQAATNTATVAADTKPDASLTNTYWKLVELNGGPVEPGEGRELHMILKGQSQVGGHSGCNQFTGSYTATGDSLSIGPLAGTRKMCADGMEQEYAFLQALEQGRSFDISGEDMSINDAQGAVIMRFVAVYLQ